MRAGLFIASLLLLGSAGLATAQQAASPAQPARRGGYLSVEQTPEAALILPPAPVEGSARYEFDRHVFKQSRALKDTPRWTMAQNDNLLGAADLMNSFSCSLGVKLTPQSAPAITRIIGRSLIDADRGSRTAKDVFKRKRPYLIDEGDICIEKTQRLADSPDYPSGHVTIAWTLGLALAQAAPERSTQILTRARAFGESRAVCGVHNASAIEAGRTTGATVFAAINGTADFRADVEAARAEIAAARENPANAVDPAVCRAEAELIARTPYPQ